MFSLRFTQKPCYHLLCLQPSVTLVLYQTVATRRPVCNEPEFLPQDKPPANYNNKQLVCVFSYPILHAIQDDMLLQKLTLMLWFPPEEGPKPLAAFEPG